VKKSMIFTALTLLLTIITFETAKAESAYDGAWSLDFTTQRGACDTNYNFDVNISNGNVSHPNLLKFKGRVMANGLVHASVAVGDKYASGVGNLSRSRGRGTWRGHMGAGRCSGYWTAQKV
jgi:hypothetical protein